MDALNTFPYVLYDWNDNEVLMVYEWRKCLWL